MQQVPAPVPPVPDPPVPPDFPVEVFGPGPAEFIPVFGMLTGVIIVGMFMLGPIGKAIGAILRHKLMGGGEQPQIAAEELEELHARLETVTKQVAELAERQDFTDRMLAQVRKEKALPGSGMTDVAG